MQSNGHHRIAYLAGPERSWISGCRWESLRSVCEWTGQEAQLILSTAPTSEGSRRAARDVIASGATVAVCYNDLLVIGLMHELQAAEVNLPDGFSVIGFDNILGSDFTRPALTTIACPLSACRAAALDLILAALSGSVVSRPVTFFVAPVLLQDKDVLAGRSRHGFCPQSFMIRGVLSPGPAWRQLIADRGTTTGPS